MANPSLQIGNDNWAVKEDNLLGYSTAGTRFVPEPITMTRGSASTRVNPSGLVETVELLGSEEVTCGDFSCADPNAVWTKSANWTIANNLATSDGSQTGNVSLKQSNTLNNLTTGTTYKVQFTISGYVAGVINPHLRGVQSGNVTGDGIKTSYITAGSGSDGINLYAGSTFKGSISNVSVKESTRNDLARVDYDGSVSSLLVEPQRTNLIPYSEDFSNAAWSKSGSVTIESNSVTSPSGILDGSKLVSNNATSNQLIKESFGVNNGNDYTLSCFVKKQGFDYIHLRFEGGGGSFPTKSAFFNINNGTLGTIDSGITATIEDYNNGWYRVTATNTATATATATIRIQLASSDNTDNVVGNGTSGTYIWGAQLEEGSYATSYIPNFGTALGVTRVQDQYEKTGISDLINSEEGVMSVEMAALADDLSYRQISLSDGTSNNRIYLQYNAVSNNVAAVVKVSGSTTAYTSTTLSSSNITNFNKIGFKWKLNDFALWINGVEVSIDTNGGVPTGLNEFTFNQTSSDFFGKVKQLQVYKTALSDDELTVLTGTSGVHFYPSYATMASGLTYKIE